MDKQLWLDYSFLTCEMLKALTREDIDLFEELIDQREKLQHSIDSCKQKDFRASAEGKTLIEAIYAEDQKVLLKMRMLMNQHQNRQSLASAYGGLVNVGYRMDKNS